MSVIAHERVDAFRVRGLHDATIMRATYKKQRFAAHSHDTYVIGLITAGALRFRCGRQLLTAPAGTLCIINPGEVQTGEAVSVEGWSYWTAYLPAKSFQPLLEEMPTARDLPFFSTRVTDDITARTAAENFFRAVTATSLPLAQSELSISFLTLLLERFHKNPSVSNCGFGEVPLIAVAKEYMAAHFSRSIGLAEVAAVAGVTSFHLTRLFKANTGLAMHAWLVQYRIERAREMLLRGVPPASVAADCGFSDQAHMARWLRRITGMTPKDVQSMSRTLNQ